MNSIIWVLSWIFIILGFLLVVAGSIGSTYNLSKERYKGHASGTVVEIVAGMPDQRGLESGVHDYYYPVIAYFARGQFFKEQYTKGSNPCPFTVNQKIALRYDLENPEKFVIAKPTRLHYLSRLSYFAGLFFCISGGIAFLLYAMRAFR